MRLSTQHIPFERLADLLESRLAGDELAEAQRHLTACERCAREAAQLGRVLALMRADDSVDAPRDVLSETIRLFGASRADGREPGLVSRILATLSFDSNALRPAFGVRSGQTAPARQLLFNAGDFDVDLRLARGDAGWSVTGQILGPCAGGGRVEVARADAAEEILAGADLNEPCEFTLPPLEAGSYLLRLRVGEVEVQVPGLELNA